MIIQYAKLIKQYMCYMGLATFDLHDTYQLHYWQYNIPF